MNPDFWRTIFDAIEVPLFLHDAQFRVLLANQAYCRAAGMTEAEAQGKPYWEVFPRGTGPLPGCKNSMIGTGCVASREEVSVGEKLFLSAGYTVHDDQGNVLYALHVLSDITAQRQNEAALRKSKDLLQTVVETVPVRIFWKDRDSRYMGCNTQFAQDAGHSSPDELAGKTDFEMPWKDRAELYIADDKAVMESGTPKLDYEEQAAMADGNTVWVRTSKVPMHDASNQVIGILGIYQDITERKISENKLRLSAQLLDSAADSIMAFDLDGNFIYLNEAAWKTRGYTYDELMAMNLHALDVPAYEKFIEAKIGELMVEGSNIFEAAHRCKDGSIMPIEVTSRIVETDGRKVIISASRDITERRAAEKALLASESQLKVILESTGDGILAVDRQGKVLKANRRFADIWKIPQSLIAVGDDRALLGYVLEQLAEPDAFLKKVQSLYVSDSTDLGLIYFKDGRCVERFSSPMLEGTEIVGRVWSFRDITERKRAEIQLEISEERHRNILRTSMDGFWIADSSGHILEVNDAYCELSGYAREALLNMRISDVEATEIPEVTAQHMQEIMAKGKVRFETRHRRRDGQLLDIESTVVYQADKEGGNFFAFLRDITARKKAEANLAEQLEELRRWHETTMDRERRILELKHEVNELLGQDGQPPRYPSAESPDLSQNQTGFS